MSPILLAPLLVILVVLAILVVQNLSPALALSFLGTTSATLPLSVWILLALAAGFITSVIILALFQFSATQSGTPSRQRSNFSSSAKQSVSPTGFGREEYTQAASSDYYSQQSQQSPIQDPYSQEPDSQERFVQEPYIQEPYSQEPYGQETVNWERSDTSDIREPFRPEQRWSEEQVTSRPVEPFEPEPSSQRLDLPSDDAVQSRRQQPDNVSDDWETEVRPIRTWDDAAEPEPDFRAVDSERRFDQERTQDDLEQNLDYEADDYGGDPRVGYYEAEQQPQTQQWQGSNYSYGYRKAEDERPEMDQPQSSSKDDSKSGANSSSNTGPESVYDANYRVIIPPQAAPTQIQSEGDDDWGILDEDEDETDLV
ncbi:MAG: hypothetical protein ACFBSC_14925 [Microcoleaceae cyanobacterium]